MARAYGKVLCSIWSDEDFLALTMPARLLYLALISQPDITPAGVLPITVGRWRAYLSPVATRDDVWATLRELGAARFVLLDEDDEEVWVRALMKVDGRLDNPNLRASISTALTSMRSDQLRAAAVAEFERIAPGNRPSERRADADATPSRRHPSPQQPAASSPQPSALSSSSSTDLHPQTPAPAAAAAVEVLVTHRLATEPKVRSPQRYAERIRRDETATHSAALAGYPNDADPVDIAVAVFGLTRDQAMTADYHRRAALP